MEKKTSSAFTDLSIRKEDGCSILFFFFLTGNGRRSANALRGVEDKVQYSTNSARADSNQEKKQT
jgi:hypothetical protein